MSLIKQEEFEDLVRPVIKFLNERGHPHMTVVITQTDAELLEGIKKVSTKDYIKD